ncbi:MAG: SBBP repeat-containing protein [Acidobacteria bacterium]|nr:SBBP repeat-containing protein [Acidobacteriota bacterium]
MFGKVRARAIYPRIDLVYYGSELNLEYDFIISPGGDPRSIRLEFPEIGKLHLSREGDLHLIGNGGSVIQRRPVAYQEIAGRRTEVAARYELTNSGCVRFHLGEYDRTRPLVIDPVVSYATYLGGGRSDIAAALELDRSGNVYLAGDTFSTNFLSTASALRGSNSGDWDAYVTKLNPSGAVVFSTYIGGGQEENLRGLAVDASGSVVIAGYTDSANFPIASAIQEVNRGGTLGYDGFIAKLNPAGNGLIFSTYLGGNLDDLLFGLTLDSAGNIYVAGSTSSQNFPLSLRAYQPRNRGLLNVFVTKINSAGSAILFSTYVGGADADVAYAIAADDAGNAYFTGYASSKDFPVTASAIQNTNRGGPTVASDAIVCKLQSSGEFLSYCTYLGGGTGDDLGLSIAVDREGNAYVTGRTESTDFPVTAGVLQRSLSGSSDAFVSKVNPTGSALLYSTFLGGTRRERGEKIILDRSGNVYLGGTTSSPNHPLANAIQTTLKGESDAFVTQLNAGGSAVLNSTYFGGNGEDILRGLAIDANGDVHLSGEGDSTDLAVTANALQKQFGGGFSDTFYARLSFAAAAPTLAATPLRLEFTGVAAAAVPPQTIAVTATPGASIPWMIDAGTTTGGNWLSVNPRIGTGSSSVNVFVSTTGLQPGSYSGTLTLINNTTNARVTVVVILTVTAAGAQIPANGVVHGASFLVGPVSPGLIINIFGSNLGPPQLLGLRLNSAGLVDTTLGEVRVLFDGVPAPLVYVSGGQLGAIGPYSVAGKSTTQMLVEYRGIRSNPVTLQVVPSSPAIFSADSSGRGPGAILNQDGSVNTAANPASRNSIIVLFATGEGQTDPPGIDGKPAIDVFPKPVLPVRVEIGGIEAEVVYAGAAPGFVAGVLQVNARIPESSASGAAIPVTLRVGPQTGPGVVTVAIE